MNEMGITQLTQMFMAVSNRIIENEQYLTEIDLQIGDGDHGSSMALGFRKVKQVLANEKFQYGEDVFKQMGTALLDNMGGASGVVFGTMFVSGTVTREGKEELGLEDFANIFRTSLNAIEKRGGAVVGEKTMVDALEPATKALEDAIAQGNGLLQGMQKASRAAQRGMEATKYMLARHGRAKYFGERVIGCQDAGATSVALIFDAMTEWIERHSDEAGVVSGKICTLAMNPTLHLRADVEKMSKDMENEFDSFDYNISEDGRTISRLVHELEMGTFCLSLGYKEDVMDSFWLADEIEAPNDTVIMKGRMPIQFRVLNKETNEKYRFRLKGSRVNQETVDDIVRKYEDQLWKMDCDDIIVISEKMAEGMPQDLYKSFIRGANKKEIRTILIGGSNLLLERDSVIPTLMKIDLEELEWALGKKLRKKDTIVQTVRNYIRNDKQMICVQVGSQNVLLISAEEAYYMKMENGLMKERKNVSRFLIVGMGIAMIDQKSMEDILKMGAAMVNSGILEEGIWHAEKKAFLTETGRLFGETIEKI